MTEHTINDLKKKIEKNSLIKSNEKIEKFINENQILSELILAISNKKLKQSTTPIICFHILNVLKDFYKLDLNLEYDCDVEKMVNEINERYENKFNKYKNLDSLVNKKINAKKHCLKHST